MGYGYLYTGEIKCVESKSAVFGSGSVRTGNFLDYLDPDLADLLKYKFLQVLLILYLTVNSGP